MIRRGKNIEKLKLLIIKLVNQESLEQKYYDHPLYGNFSNSRECHIEPDWLLIYTSTKDSIRFERTGSHADLFK